ncbi:hypothetical protein ILYODFUR_023795 [Ilyodon furcidens]|uniref:Uncharacterized protein n=1 Tax=Ilyodon furcidens TaxID=33524 RepID=A0ABV0UUP8_9TELE
MEVSPVCFSCERQQGPEGKIPVRRRLLKRRMGGACRSRDLKGPLNILGTQRKVSGYDQVPLIEEQLYLKLISRTRGGERWPPTFPDFARHQISL